MVLEIMRITTCHRKSNDILAAKTKNCRGAETNEWKTGKKFDAVRFHKSRIHSQDLSERLKIRLIRLENHPSTRFRYLIKKLSTAFCHHFPTLYTS